MKIALVMKYYSNRRGGGELDFVRLSNSLLERGHEVHLFLHGWDDPPPQGVTIHQLPMQNWWAPAKILSFPYSYRQVCRLDEFDVVHAMTQVWPSDLYWNGGGLFETWLPTRYGTGLRCSMALLNPRHAANKYVENRIFLKGNYRKVVLLAPHDQPVLEKKYRVNKDQIRVIPNGVNPNIFSLRAQSLYRETKRRALGLEEDTILFVMVGGDWVRKGLLKLLEAFASVQAPSMSWRLAVVGKDSPKSWQRRVEYLGLGQQVLFSGRSNNIAEWYAAADVAVLASNYDGYGNVVPEALACGTPVLSSSHTGASFLIEHGHTGWVINFDQPPPSIHKDYVAILEAVLSNSRAHLASMGKLAVQSTQYLTWDWTVDQLEEVYREIAREKNR